MTCFRVYAEPFPRLMDIVTMSYVVNDSPPTCIPQTLTPVRSQTARSHDIERAEAAFTHASTDNAPLKTHINALPPPHTSLTTLVVKFVRNKFHPHSKRWGGCAPLKSGAKAYCVLYIKPSLPPINTHQIQCPC